MMYFSKGPILLNYQHDILVYVVYASVEEELY